MLGGAVKEVQADQDESTSTAVDDKFEIIGAVPACVGSVGGTFRRHRNKDEENSHKIREAFYVVAQGVDVMFYSESSGSVLTSSSTAHTSSYSSKVTRIRQVVWLEPENLRICVDSRRMTPTDTMKGKKSPGLYLRDIAEIRGGADAFFFKKATPPPESPQRCISLIGTEMTICLEFPTNDVRDWFLERFKLVHEDVLSQDELVEWKQRTMPSTKEALSFPELSAAQQMMALLTRGVQILHHNKGGKVVRSNIYYEQASHHLTIRPVETPFFSSLLFGVFRGAHVEQWLHLSDIVEIRPGSHSFGFVRTESTDKWGECMSIVGTEATLDLQLATANARDLFAQKLKIFIQFWELNLASGL
jgi:hypothetical protein